MHDGSIKTLDEVVSHYEAGGRTIDSGPYAGRGRDNPNRSTLVVGFKLTQQERRDLLAFLESLTDEEFLRNSRFSNPWISGPNAHPRKREIKFDFKCSER